MDATSAVGKCLFSSGNLNCSVVDDPQSCDYREVRDNGKGAMCHLSVFLECAARAVQIERDCYSKYGYNTSVFIQSHNTTFPHTFNNRTGLNG